jgi:betaine-aldehyde dehydrogenase
LYNADWSLRIAGQKVCPNAPPLSVINPANRTQAAVVSSAGPAEIDQAVQSAHNCHTNGTWRNLSARERGKRLRALAQGIRARVDELAYWETVSVGKPLTSARGEVLYAADVFDYYAGTAPTATGATYPLGSGGHGLSFREPVGVCGLIIPWNFPLVIAAWKCAPALAAGNPVVLKPAEWTPLTALLLADIAWEADIPPQAFHVVPGLGETAGAALVKHPLVRKIAFTGSTEVGSAILRTAGADLKRVSLELGGKSACIVFEDADIEKAAAGVFSVFDNTGQDCCARSRFLVQASVYNAFVERFVANTKAITVGDPMQPTTQLGPLVTDEHRSRVEAHIEKARTQGAHFECGGARPKGLEEGCYFEPTVLTAVTPSMDIANEEVFGPVAAILPFNTEEEAVRIANNSRYGLSGSIWTRDIARAMRVSRSIETGVLGVNTNSSVHLDMPFGGFKHSGIGRDLGIQAMEQYLEWKSVYISAE